MATDSEDSDDDGGDDDGLAKDVARLSFMRQSAGGTAIVGGGSAVKSFCGGRVVVLCFTSS